MDCRERILCKIAANIEGKTGRRKPLECSIDEYTKNKEVLMTRAMKSDHYDEVKHPNWTELIPRDSPSTSCSSPQDVEEYSGISSSEDEYTGQPAAKKEKFHSKQTEAR